MQKFPGKKFFSFRKENEMNKKLLTDDEIITASIEVLHKEPLKSLVDDTPILQLFGGLYMSAILADLFGEPNFDEYPPFETICECIQDDFKYEIFHGGDILHDNYAFCISKLPQDKLTYKKTYKTMKEAYNALISRIL